MTAPLEGVRVIDLTRYGPGPYCAMLLGDLGADVIVVDEATSPDRRSRRSLDPGFVELLAPLEYMRRNARRIALDLRHPDGQAVMQRLVASADVFIEGFRPGVAERLRLGSDTLRAAHPRLIYCSISGFGQAGPYREVAAHDINYLALGGLLGLTGPASGTPLPPGTLIADLAGGGLPAVVAILGALLARERTGEGQAIDVSVQEGVAALMSPMLALLDAGQPVARGESVFTGGAPWYGVYEAADGRHLAVGAIEPWFWAELCRRLDQPDWIDRQFDRAAWPSMKDELARQFRSRPLADWLAVFDGADVCVTPVTELAALRRDPQLASRKTVGESGQVRALPLMTGASQELRSSPSAPGADADAILIELGYDDMERARLLAAGGVAGAATKEKR